MKIKIVGQHKRLRDFYIRPTLSSAQLSAAHAHSHAHPHPHPHPYGCPATCRCRAPAASAASAAFVLYCLHCDVIARGNGRKMLAGIN